MIEMKRVLALIMVLILALAFTACSKENSNTPGGDLGSESDSSSKPNNSNNGLNDLLPEFDKTYDIEETHLTDTYDVSITATQLSYSNSSVTLSLKIENKSDSDREVYAGTTGYGCNSVNGYMIHDGYLRCEVAPGATEEDKISFSYDELYAHGISVIADIGVGFDVEDDDYHHEYSGMITIKTKKADDYDYSEDTYIKTMKGNTLQNAYGITVDAFSESAPYSQGGISLISQAVVRNKNGDGNLALEFKNEADQDIYVNLTGLYINDQEVSTSYLASDLICLGKRDVVSVSLRKYFEENTTLKDQVIQSVKFSIELTNSDSKSLTQKTAVTVDFN